MFLETNEIEISGYEKARAIMSTLFHAALMVENVEGCDPVIMSRYSIQHAEAHLEQLGIVNPDTC